MDLEAEIPRVVLPLIAIANDARWHPVGTSFVVCTFSPNNALLITAAHNLDWVLRIDTPHGREAANAPPDFRGSRPDHVGLSRTRLYAGVDGPGGFVLAELIQTWHHKDLDIAFALAKIDQDTATVFSPRLALNTTPIGEGTKVVAIGYCGMTARFSSTPDYDLGQFRVEFSKCLKTVSGSVKEVCR